MTRSSILRGELEALLARPPLDLAAAALIIAKIEHPSLEPSATLLQLDRWGALAQDRLNRRPDAPVRARLGILNQVLYVDAGLDGNRGNYNDFRNNFLNLVVERRLGIPISLALIYMEVAQRCGIEVFGVSFPGHFLVRVPDDAGRDGSAVILDPFNGGCEMDESDCQELLQRHLGDNAQFALGLLQPCSGRQMLARMLGNLKRVYIELRSFPQAHLATDLLLTVEPTFGSELRDRGLIAYHLDHYAAALSDLEQYLRLRNWSDADRDEHQHVQAHVRTLRARLARLN